MRTSEGGDARTMTSSLRRSSGKAGKDVSVEPEADDVLMILVVDREDAAERLAVDLAGQPIHMTVAHDAVTALLLVGRARPDMVVLGPVPGRIDAVVLLEALRKHEPQLPVIVGLSAEDDRLATHLAALEPAAVIHHPYQPVQLLRLVQSLTPSGHDLVVAPLPIDLGRLRIDASPPGIQVDGVRLMLPRREYLLLRFLAEKAGQVVSHAEIGMAVWGTADGGSANSLAVHVMRLRRRLGNGRGGAQWIVAVRGIGYTLTVPADTGNM